MCELIVYIFGKAIFYKFESGLKSYFFHITQISRNAFNLARILFKSISARILFN